MMPSQPGFSRLRKTSSYIEYFEILANASVFRVLFHKILYFAAKIALSGLDARYGGDFSAADQLPKAIFGVENQMMGAVARHHDQNV